MTLTLPGVSLMSENELELSQWFTPPSLSKRIVDWSKDVLVPGSRVLEPAVGSGSLLAALLESVEHLDVTAYEIDLALVEEVARRFPSAKIVHADFTGIDHAGIEGFNVSVLNPPYEKGLDGVFLSLSMDLCDHVVALIRTVALNGDERARNVWERVSRNEWHLRGVRFLSSRPKFIAGRSVVKRRGRDGAKADFCVVKMSRSFGLPAPGTEIGWW